MIKACMTTRSVLNVDKCLRYRNIFNLFILCEVKLFVCFHVFVLCVHDNSAKFENVDKESVASQHIL